MSAPVVSAPTVPQPNYARRGSRPLRVLLHAIGHCWRAWAPVLDRLAANHDAIAVDLPGFGKSAPLHGPSGCRRDHRRRHGILRPARAGPAARGSEQPRRCDRAQARGQWPRLISDRTVAGRILGSVGVQLGIRRACCPPRTTLLPIPLLRASVGPAGLRVLTLGMIVRWPEHLTPERAIGHILARRDCTAFSAVGTRVHGYAFRDSPYVPVTVAWGTNDQILLHRQATRARRRLPGAYHLDLPGCGYAPMSDAPNRLASTILAATKEARA
jgi:pimeloyl-ACP methyl ester carboxylesterase